jgi:hypothetical protein
VVNHFLVGTFCEAYLPIQTQEMVRRAGASLWFALSPMALAEEIGNRIRLTAVPACSRRDVESFP